MCLAAHKLLLLKSCYEECLSCVITILVVCISAPLAKNLHPTQFPLWLYYQKTPVQASDQNTSFYMYNQKDNLNQYTTNNSDRISVRFYLHCLLVIFCNMTLKNHTHVDIVIIYNISLNLILIIRAKAKHQHFFLFSQILIYFRWNSKL